jgi:hypothetical membrane protein
VSARPGVGASLKVARWALASSGLAPVALIGGWTVAATLQEGDFSSVHDTISALAQHGATDRWLMTSALTVLGLCHLTTAAGLGPARPAGRAVLAVGGAATLGVAAFPLHADGQSRAHGIVALIAFVSLAVWPLLAGVDGHGRPLEKRWSLLAGVVLSALVVLFAITLGGRYVGLTERLAAGAQSLWPLVVVLAARRAEAAAR